MSKKIFRVAIMGPESTGKTTLAKTLAKHYNTIWVPEYSRKHVEKLHLPYTREDILLCARKQLESEQQALMKATKLLFADTELINCSVWLKDVFNEEDDWIQTKISEYEYDLYLLMNYDLTFVHDPVRENPHRRKYFFEWYRREMEERKFKYRIIQGIGDTRMQMAVSEIDKLI
jgi:NadR type nicotinamide-nucleotide adenylyltransferase